MVCITGDLPNVLESEHGGHTENPELPAHHLCQQERSRVVRTGTLLVGPWAMDNGRKI